MKKVKVSKEELLIIDEIMQQSTGHYNKKYVLMREYVRVYSEEDYKSLNNKEKIFLNIGFDRLIDLIKYGYELEGELYKELYTEDNLPYKFKFKVIDEDTVYNLFYIEGIITVAWIDDNGYIDYLVYREEQVLSYLNKGYWEIIN